VFLVFVENHKNSHNSPYKFNAKEQDAETGYYYYGARYYNPRVSLWLNVDPLADYNPFYNSEHYIDGQHNGGVYNSGNLNPYIYTYQNPIVFVDPNGKQAKVTDPKLMRFGHSPYLNTTKTSLNNNRLIPQEFGLRPSAAHLLSKVSGVSYNDISSTKLTFTECVVCSQTQGYMTTGDSAKNFAINGNGEEPFGFERFMITFMAHEVGHIPQSENFSSKTKWQIFTLANYVENGMLTPGVPFSKWHDTEFNEKIAEKGTETLRGFNNFVNQNYGKNALDKLFKNKSNNEKIIMNRINTWYKAYEKSKE